GAGDGSAAYEAWLWEEPSDSLPEHAGGGRYVWLTTPVVKLETDADLDVGEFGIATRLVRGPKPPEGAPPTAPAAGATMVYRSPPVEPVGPVEGEEPHEEPESDAVLTIDGHDHPRPLHAVVLGRSKDCDIRLFDPNVSRRHAEVRPHGPGWTIVDLDSTNGIEVGGKRVKELALTDGAHFKIGTTE